MGLEVSGLCFGYRSTRSGRSRLPVFSGFDASFRTGEIIALTGASGRGKSTLLYLLGLMLTPDGGEVRLDERRVDNLPDAVRAGLRAHTMGFVFQDAALDPTRSVLDNVLESWLYRSLATQPTQPTRPTRLIRSAQATGETTERDARRVVSREQAAARALELLRCFGVELRADARPGQISGGQAQRIALCRALMNDPGILFADEPTGNLDRQSALVVQTAFREQADRGAAVIIATHDPALVAFCDRVVAL